LDSVIKGSAINMQHSKYHISYMEAPMEKREKVIMLKPNQQENFEIIESKKEADKIIFEAKKEAERLIYETKLENQKKYSDGFEQGKKAGLEKYNNRMNEAVDIVAEMLKEKHKMMQDYEKDIISLVTKIADKIIGTEIDRDYGTMKHIFETAITKVTEDGYEIIKVKLNKKNIIEFYPSHEIEEFMLQIKHDKKLSDEQCILETENGDIDVSYKTQLSEIEDKLINTTEQYEKN